MKAKIGINFLFLIEPTINKNQMFHKKSHTRPKGQLIFPNLMFGSIVKVVQNYELPKASGEPARKPACREK